MPYAEHQFKAKGSCSYQFHRPHHFFKPQDTQYPLEVVGQYIEAHLGAYMWQPACEEVRVAHPALERSEHMLNSSSPDAHGLW